MRLDVRFDAGRAMASLSAYQNKLRDKALVKGLNRAATTVRAEGARLIAAEMKPLRVTEVKKAISIKFATRGNLVAVVRAGGRKRIPLTALRARPTKTGVTIKVGGTVYTIAHAFINKVRKGRLGVRIRAQDFKAQLVDAVKFRGKRAGRRGLDYPIAEIMAPGIPLVFVQAKIMQGMRKVALERFNTVIAQEVKFFNSKG
jgi:hypothetical protein